MSIEYFVTRLRSMLDQFLPHRILPLFIFSLSARRFRTAIPNGARLRAEIDRAPGVKCCRTARNSVKFKHRISGTEVSRLSTRFFEPVDGLIPKFGKYPKAPPNISHKSVIQISLQTTVANLSPSKEKNLGMFLFRCSLIS